MSVTKPNNQSEAWLFYDGDCPVCRRAVEKIRPALSRNHFQFAPQQSEFGQRTLGLKPGEVLSEMKVLTPDGQLLNGTESILYMARFIWWVRPLRWLAKLPGGKFLIRRSYQWVAANRYCVSRKCNK
ncbi:MAG: thiol-disulfide oxidoreductase [Verrucomicrobiales bacterium]|nr:thiol-disulfide oxidoreductase [Verrucomicrobiales bacterium]